MRVTYYRKFPCGYEIWSEGFSLSLIQILFGAIETSRNSDNEPICPMHGKKCKAK